MTFTEHLKLELDYHYNLNAMKVIEVKDSFLTLDKNVRGCQLEPRNVCITKKYMKSLINKCNCTPFQSGFIEEVNPIDRYAFEKLLNFRCLLVVQKSMNV